MTSLEHVVQQCLQAIEHVESAVDSVKANGQKCVRLHTRLQEYGAALSTRFDTSPGSFYELEEPLENLVQVCLDALRLVDEYSEWKWVVRAWSRGTDLINFVALHKVLDLCWPLLGGGREDETMGDELSLETWKDSLMQDDQKDREALLTAWRRILAEFGRRDKKMLSDSDRHLLKVAFMMDSKLRQQLEILSTPVESNVTASLSGLEDGSSCRELLKEDIRLGGLIGRGSFGTVYHASWLGVPVAVKQVEGTGHMVAEERTAFFKEAKLFSQLHHPQVVQLYGVCIANDPCWMVMELMESGSLFQLITSRGLDLSDGSPPFEIHIAIDIMIQIAMGMDYLHKHRVVHRDLKSGNILTSVVEPRTGRCQVKIADFGLAKMKESSSICQTNVGTARWMAPELLQGEDYSFPADVYSFAMTCYEILSGRVPWHDLQRDWLVKTEVVDRQRRPLLPSNCPKPLKALIQRCWASRPAARPGFPEICEKLQEVQEAIHPLPPDNTNNQRRLATSAPHESPWANPRPPPPPPQFAAASDNNSEGIVGGVGGEGSSQDEGSAVLRMRGSEELWRRLVELAPEDDSSVSGSSSMAGSVRGGYTSESGQEGGGRERPPKPPSTGRAKGKRTSRRKYRGASLCSAGFESVRGLQQSEVDSLLKRAEEGDMMAQHSIGQCYAIGSGFAKDGKEAMRWFSLAAAQGLAAAQYSLGVCYESGEEVEHSSEEALKWYSLAAEGAHAGAQFNMGVCFEHGRGVACDRQEAVRWYLKAAHQNYAAAQYNLGICYQKGQGVEKSWVEAARWYKRAAELGNKQAQEMLGYCYETGKGVTRDERQAVRWYRAAAALGLSLAKVDLGCCYLHGKGVERDAYEAFRWFRRAAEQGDAAGQKEVGWCYEYGMGVEQDEEQAFHWYHMSAINKNAASQYILGRCYERGYGVEKDTAEAVKWFHKAAEQGNADAQCALGESFLFGSGVTQDTAEGLWWCRLAARQGHSGAQARLLNGSER